MRPACQRLVAANDAAPGFDHRLVGEGEFVVRNGPGKPALQREPVVAGALHGMLEAAHARAVASLHGVHREVGATKQRFRIDAVRRDGKASFCVVGQDQVVPAVYTTYYRSVTVFGKMRILETDEEKRAAIEKLAVKYAPDDSEENRDQAIRREWKGLCVLEMRVEHMTGKKASELL